MLAYGKASKMRFCILNAEYQASIFTFRAKNPATNSQRFYL
jgi:hypothetical protein